ncbi:MAG: site-specific DNA-methyltransferase [Candidatus Marinimicrobia bacterium]|nr:site-specific DNA-methyltransferase [Candidatus Neomarinimicrobiota bacterium]
MEEVVIKGNRYYNQDCITGAQKNIKADSVDLIITDPPYGIDGDKLHRHYNRDEDFIVDGYVEIPADQYADFSHKWIQQAERILKPGGSIYIVSGYTNLYHILDALRDSELEEVNHIIWKYNFGVYTKKKYISSHYHILFYQKPGGERTFNLYSRYGHNERDKKGGSLNYQDREDVWIINREYKPGRKKNKNELPKDLLIKIMQYSSKQGDLVCDLFMGGFSTAEVAVGLKRKFVGFEIAESIFSSGVERIKNVKKGSLINKLRTPDSSKPKNQNQPWTNSEKKQLKKRYIDLQDEYEYKKDIIKKLCSEFGRGRFGIQRMLKKVMD